MKKLKSKRFDYNGQPVDHMLDLDAEKIVRAWPAPGSVAVVNLEDCLPSDLKEAIQNPADYTSCPRPSYRRDTAAHVFEPPMRHGLRL